MIKDVLITIVGEQLIDDQSDKIELITDGKFGIKDGSYFISYYDNKLADSPSSSKTIMYIKENSVVIQRTGDFSSRLVVEKGTKNACLYSTPHGDLTLSIFGKKIESNLNEKGGSLDLNYTIDANSKLLSQNVVKISIREV